ncbi:MAG: hypothetical protein K0S44_1701 [Bacteroidetes bacterium]|jgi:hypothetical protein|nr:hypothetical protein [Bacteroidota bacterium]
MTNLKKNLILCFTLVLFLAIKPLSAVNLVDRGVEIRYVKVELKEKEAFPKVIKIDNVIYPLFKTKEEAIDHVKNMGVKSDMTTVYVAASEVKTTEILAVEK